MITLEDFMILSRTIAGEARGEPFAGQVAVAHVILNRWARGGADHSIAATCLRWKQFSAWNPNDPNRALLEDMGVKDRVMRTAMRAALEAIDGLDNTLGSRHYHNKFAHPSWSDGKTPAVTIGNHKFFNDIA